MTQEQSLSKTIKVEEFSPNLLVFNQSIGVQLNRDNNFHLIRFVAASMVLFSHTFAIMTGNYDREPLRKYLGLNAAELAVDTFFIISGYLVTGSLFHRGKLSSFLWARILRIYPAVIINSLFCVFFIGILFTSFPIADYLTSSKTYSYLLNNSLLLKFNIYGYLPGTSIVNESLWTLHWEIKAYVLLTLLTFIYWRKKEIVLVTLASFLIILSLINYSFAIFSNPIFMQALRLGSFFFAGSIIYIYHDRIAFKLKYLYLSLIAIFLSIILGIFVFSYIILLPYIVISLAYIPKGFIRNFNKVGDYSYGMYLFAFPIQQSIYHLFPGISIKGMFLSAFVVTLLFAICSWHLIEKKCLALKTKI